MISLNIEKLGSFLIENAVILRVENLNFQLESGWNSKNLFIAQNNALLFQLYVKLSLFLIYFFILLRIVLFLI